MAQFPALPLWTDAYLADTRHLSTTEHGAYLLMLITAWRMPDCALPNDDEYICKITGLRRDQWRKMKPTIMAFWHELDESRVTQLRLVDERTHVTRLSHNQARRVNARWLKTKNSADTAVIPERYRSDTTLNPTPTLYQKESPTGLASESNSESTSTPHTVHQNRNFDDFWIRCPRKIGKKAAKKKYNLAVKAGIAHETLAGAMTAYGAYCDAEQLETQHICHPTTWLNQGRWDDDLTTRRKPSDSEKWQAGMAMAERMINGDDQRDQDPDDEHRKAFQIPRCKH